MKSVTPDEAIVVLNRLLQKDCWAMDGLIKHRVKCNEDLANDESCQVKQESRGGYSVSLIGIINAIFGTDVDKCGYIAYSIDPGGFIIRFQRFEPKSQGNDSHAKNP